MRDVDGAASRTDAAALETHGFPRTALVKGYDLEPVSSCSLEAGSGEGQSCRASLRWKAFWSERKRGSNQRQGLPGQLTTMRMRARKAQFELWHRSGLIPGLAPVRRRSSPRLLPSSHAESFDGERSFVLHHEVDGSAELVSENGKGFGFAVLFSELLYIALSGLVGA